MVIKCAIKYMIIGVFVIYGTVTINMLSWISDKHLATSRTVARIQGKNKLFLVANSTQTSYENIDSDLDSNHYSNQDLYNHMVFENNAKRKRKILAELIHEYHINKRNPSNKHLVFKSIGNISVFSAYYDDRDNLDHDAPVIRIMGITKLDSTENLVCRYTDKGFDSWILANKYEMCENHGKHYGGYMYLCNAPPNVEIIPRKVYLQSLSQLSEPVTAMTGSYISLDLLPISRREASVVMDSSDILTEPANKFHLSNLKGTYSLEDRINNDSDKDNPGSKLQGNKYSLIESNKLKLNLKENLRKYGLSSTRKLHPLKTIDSEMNKERFSITQQTANKHRESISPFKVAVCIPPLFGSIKLSNFIQFIELLRILGVDHFFAYTMSISSDIDHLLKYYEKQNILTKINWMLPEEIHDSIWYNGQIVAIQDCLYRTMSNYNYTAFIDIDELIIPRQDFAWPSMIRRLQKEEFHDAADTKTGGFSFKSAFFDPEYIEDDSQNVSKLSFLRVQHRNDIISSVRTKLIVVPEHIVEMGIHHISRTVNQTYSVNTQDVDSSVALIHHYRACTTQSDERMQCGQYVDDQSILKYDRLLMKKYQDVVKQTIKYFKML